MPRISIVVPIVDDATDPAETLRSLDEQDYPDLEVIRPTGASSYAQALERGFAAAGGEILARLVPGERLVPRALHRVAAEFVAGRQVVLGRSAILVPEVGDVAVEYRQQYRSPFDHVAVWLRGFDAVAHASLFWHRSILEGAGPFREGPAFAVDYDFVCRIGRRHRIHAVDELWSVMRGGGDGHATAASDFERAQVLLATSRHHWGSWLHPLRWRSELSLRVHELQLHERARHYARQGEDAAAAGRRLDALIAFAQVGLRSPAMARGRWPVARAALRAARKG